MRTREAAELAGISADWLRQLERDGRIGPFPRDMNGHRRLTAEDVERIRTVVHCAPRASSEAVAR